MVHKPDEFSVVIGIDWSDQKHDVCLWTPDGPDLEFSVVSHQVEQLETWIQSIHQRFAGHQIAIALEQKRGPLIYFLMRYECIVLYPINPATVAKYRRAFQPSRAKDDPTDAQILVELLLKHPSKFKPWEPESEGIRALQRMVEFRRSLVDDKVRLTNRITTYLKNYFPQALDWFEAKDTTLFCHFLMRWPTLAAVQAESPETLLKFFTSHNSHRVATNRKRIESIQTAQALTTDPGIVEPMQRIVLALVEQLLPLLASIHSFDNRIEELFLAQDDAQLFQSLPGAGPQLAPRLLVAFGEDRSRYLGAQELLQYAGIAPVTERSGKKQWVHWRWSCPKFLRQTFVEWSAQSLRFSFWAKTFYDYQRQKGKTHQMAIRALAFKWIRILYRCWQDRVPYDEAQYLMALKKKGSPLVARFSMNC